MDNITTALKRAIDEAGETHYAICKGSRIAPPVLSHFMGGTRDIRLATAAKLAEHLGLVLVPSEWVTVPKAAKSQGRKK